jgi:hypothetical protein
MIGMNIRNLQKIEAGETNVLMNDRSEASNPSFTEGYQLRIPLFLALWQPRPYGRSFRIH